MQVSALDERWVGVVATTFVLGASGMLGAALISELQQSGTLVGASVRPESMDRVKKSRVSLVPFDVATGSLERLLGHLPEKTWIINAIGVIKPHIDESNVDSRASAIEVNAEFPYRLHASALSLGHNMIQIATDCVFSGNRGRYSEADVHDALDVYGKTKSLGEVKAPNVWNLRSSIIGPEVGRSSSLLEWVRNQPNAARLRGYVNHEWNGLTTQVFSRVCRGLVESECLPAGSYHVLPRDTVSKFTLLELLATRYNRRDLIIQPFVADPPVDRTLDTLNEGELSTLWSSAGYSRPPSIAEQIEDLTDYNWA